MNLCAQSTVVIEFIIFHYHYTNKITTNISNQYAPHQLNLNDIIHNTVITP